VPGGRTGTMSNPAPRGGGVFRSPWSASVSDPHPVGRTLWGRASSLPVRVAEAGLAFPRECGDLGVVDSRLLSRTLPSSPAFWDPWTLWRPWVPASHHRRGRAWVDWEGCDHADGTPAAFHFAGRTDFIAPPGGARYDIVRSVKRCREVAPAQCQTRHPEGAGSSARRGRPRFRIHTRWGGHCGGGLPACPSGLLKQAWRFRESAGTWVLWTPGCCPGPCPRHRPSGTHGRRGVHGRVSVRGRRTLDSRRAST